MSDGRRDFEGGKPWGPPLVSADCTRCSGSGKVTFRRICRQCGGRWDGDRMSCMFCDHGYTEAEGPCFDCGGSGKAIVAP